MRKTLENRYYAFVNGISLDGTREMKPMTCKAVLVGGEEIVDIPSDIADLMGNEIIDLKSRYLLPGMMNLHVHIPGSGEPKSKPLDVGQVIDTMTMNR